MVNDDKECMSEHFSAGETVQEYVDVTAENNHQFSCSEFLPFNKYRYLLIAEQAKSLLAPGARVLEVGTGVGRLCARLLQDNLDVTALDMSAEMVASAKQRLAAAGHDSDRVYEGDFLDWQAGDATGSQHGFDAVIANGVICYYEDQVAFLAKTASLLDTGGRLFVTHRNSLFNLFALNAGTLDFFSSELLCHLNEQARVSTVEQLNASGGERFAKDPQQASNTHLYRNAQSPFDVSTLYQAAGFQVEKILYTFIHPAPPHVELTISAEAFAALQDSLRDDWRGAFLGSQFLVVASRA